jgi:hypothetical protein
MEIIPYYNSAPANGYLVAYCYIISFQCAAGKCLYERLKLFPGLLSASTHPALKSNKRVASNNPSKCSLYLPYIDVLLVYYSAINPIKPALMQLLILDAHNTQKAEIIKINGLLSLCTFQINGSLVQISPHPSHL